ncbi:MAG: hypothetical protein EYX74_03730 [Desulfobulbaceae bacterium]|nr:MAG: hypothetical protein EYX74_03730 [Desulfobulbaceae bacterium]
MKLNATIIAIIITLAFIGAAVASMPGHQAKFAGGGMGGVTFDGTTHAQAGLSCTECHTAIFQMARTAKITMADHNNGTFCFSCHQEGGRAFSATNCIRCHTQ